MKMNNKAQSFSVFQLVISAVIAVAILAVLLGVMSSMQLINTDPDSAMGDTLSKAAGAYGSSIRTENMTFAQGTSVSAATLAESAGLDPNQICFSLGKYENGDFEILSVGDRQTLEYDGRTAKNISAYVVCDLSQDNLEEYLGASSTLEPLTGGSIDECGCPDDDVCCVIVLANPKS